MTAMSFDTTTAKNQLEQELAELEKELQSLGVQNPDTPADWIPTPSAAPVSTADENVVADRSEDWQERRGTLDLLETRYNNIKRALQKIAAGEYGVCEVGGEAIENDRLAANPAARTCKAHLEEEANLPR